ncbi:MAG: Na(+)/H(+) antiporter subunit B [Wenzhouxiangella sp.]|nr:MAG: Na(+)/H(+) antiporter subunit B [Wenzhouxiangella sp.]
MIDNGILRVISRFLIPFILLVGLYIQFHGEYSPGGGFQAGVVFAAGWILYVLIYGLERGLNVISLNAMYVLSAVGVLLYAFTGLAGVLLGGKYLDFTPFSANPHTAQQTGIIIVEFGVGLTVATVAMLLFTMFARRRGEWLEALEEEDEGSE